MNRKALILTILAAVVLLAVSALAWGQYNSSNNSNETQAPGTSTTEQTPPNTESASDQSTISSVVITYTNDGFQPGSAEVKAGDTITLKNNSDRVLNFSSDDHPTHLKQPELNIGEVAPGESKTFTVDAKGTWGYHNHENSAHKGTLVVK